MTTVKTRIHVAPDGTLSGRAAELPAGEHDAEIMLLDAAEPAGLDARGLLSLVQAIQTEVAALPVLDSRSADEIIGYNEHGHFA
jgi:hypothetical protein